MRGYGIVEDDNGIPIKTSESIETGDNIRVKLHDGELACTVNNIVLQTKG